ncbi:hypothetical protein KC345_g7559 [Hortaea werneckii]|nr:hypothetical protein KC345_g7559 [Hortaea werneckii]
MPPKTCNVSDTAFLLSCLKHVNGKIDTAAVGEECGGMTVNAVVKKIKRMKEVEARQTTSTDRDISVPIDDKGGSILVSCMNNTENGKVNTSKVKDETGMASVSAVNTKLNKIKAENTIAGVDSAGDSSAKQSSVSAGGKKKDTRDGGGKGASTKKRKLAETDDAEQKVEEVKKEEQMDDDDD